MVATPFEERQTSREYHPTAVIDLRESWQIGPVEVPTRLVLAPMAGVSVQAFRRQGRRYGAGLVCSEMVSCAGIEHRNEKTLGYLRVASDEHPLAIQLFGSEPRPMADAARMVEAVGADIVDVNFGCPVKKVTKTGAGAHLLEDPDRACRIVEAIAGAVEIPVTVKVRRGVQNGSRAALELGPRLVEAGVSSHHAASSLGPADVHRYGRPRPDGGARRARRRAGGRLRRRDLARSRAGRARHHRRRGGHGRPRCPGEPVGAARDRRRRRDGADARGGRGRARPVRARDGARARRASRIRLPQEVLRLVPRRWTLPEGVQAGAPPARLARGDRAAAARGGAGGVRDRANGSRRRSRRAPR